MPYPGQFHRLVMIGKNYGDTWNMSLSIVPSALGELGMPEVNHATLTAVSAIVQDWFNNPLGSTGCGFSINATLESIKLNRIGPDGHYVDPIAQEDIFSPVNGANSMNAPPQLALVATLGTRLERGRGSKGRIYLITSIAQSVGVDGRISVSNASNTALGVKSLIESLNSEYALIGKCGVASNAGSGKFEHITRVSVGRVVDTMRSRRSSLVEDRQEVLIA